MESQVNPPSDSGSVLAVSLLPADLLALRALFSRLPWRLAFTAALPHAVRSAKTDDVRLIVCSQELREGNWRVLFDQVRDFPNEPRFIVVSRLADEHLWAEVLNLGGFDVLATPFDAEEVGRVVSNAMRVAPRADLRRERWRAAS